VSSKFLGILQEIWHPSDKFDDVHPRWLRFEDESNGNRPTQGRGLDSAGEVRGYFIPTLATGRTTTRIRARFSGRWGFESGSPARDVCWRVDRDPFVTIRPQQAVTELYEPQWWEFGYVVASVWKGAANKGLGRSA
jgi:hypothetical protein